MCASSQICSRLTPRQFTRHPCHVNADCARIFNGTENAAQAAQQLQSTVCTCRLSAASSDRAHMSTMCASGTARCIVMATLAQYTQVQQSTNPVPRTSRLLPICFPLVLSGLADGARQYATLPH